MTYEGQNTPILIEQNSVKPSRLLDEVRNRLRLKNDSTCMGKAYLFWISRYILENGNVHSRELGGLGHSAGSQQALRDLDQSAQQDDS